MEKNAKELLIIVIESWKRVIMYDTSDMYTDETIGLSEALDAVLCVAMTFINEREVTEVIETLMNTREACDEYMRKRKECNAPEKADEAMFNLFNRLENIKTKIENT